MAWSSTVISVTSASTPLVAATQLLGAHIQDPVPCVVFNTAGVGGQSVYLGGTLTTGTGNQGLPLVPQTYLTLTLLRSDPLNAITTAGAVTVVVMLGRQ